jgi:hypothetical protein
MALQINVDYRNQPVSYHVIRQEEHIYHLRLNETTYTNTKENEYIPEKIVIRKKGMIWVSDMDNYDELINALTEEIEQFNTNSHY